MKTWLNRDGVYVQDKPKEYFVGKDSHGEDVFIGDVCMSKDTKRLFKVTEGDYFSTTYYLSKYAVKIKSENCYLSKKGKLIKS